MTCPDLCKIDASQYLNATIKAELDRLMKLKVINKLCRPDAQGNVAFPAFATPKQNTEELRFASNFRELSKCVQISPYLASPIRYAVNKMEGFQYSTNIDISMGY